MGLTRGIYQHRKLLQNQNDLQSHRRYKITHTCEQYSEVLAIVAAVVWLCAAAVSFEGYSKQKPLSCNHEILVRWFYTLPSLRDIWVQLKFVSVRIRHCFTS